MHYEKCSEEISDTPPTLVHLELLEMEQPHGNYGVFFAENLVVARGIMIEREDKKQDNFDVIYFGLPVLP